LVCPKGFGESKRIGESKGLGLGKGFGLVFDWSEADAAF
jgi:hypothetical protein